MKSKNQSLVRKVAVVRDCEYISVNNQFDMLYSFMSLMHEYRCLVCKTFVSVEFLSLTWLNDHLLRSIEEKPRLKGVPKKNKVSKSTYTSYCVVMQTSS